MGDRTIVELGSQNFGAKVLLTEEHTRPVIDDVLMIAGPEPSDRAKLKLLMREQLAGGQRLRPVVTQVQNTIVSPGIAAPVEREVKTASHTAQFTPDDSAFKVQPAKSAATGDVYRREDTRTVLPARERRHPLRNPSASTSPDLNAPPISHVLPGTAIRPAGSSRATVPHVGNPFRADNERGDDLNRRPEAAMPERVESSDRYMKFSRR